MRTFFANLGTNFRTVRAIERRVCEMSSETEDFLPLPVFFGSGQIIATAIDRWPAVTSHLGQVGGPSFQARPKASLGA